MIRPAGLRLFLAVLTALGVPSTLAAVMRCRVGVIHRLRFFTFD